MSHFKSVKVNYIYVLTIKSILQKIKLTLKFHEKKMREYYNLKN